MSRLNKTRASGEKRVRREFTVSEDQELVKFLAGYDPNTRLSISTYRDVAATSWGSTHSAPSWLARYKRSQALFDVRIDGLILTKTGWDDRDKVVPPVSKKRRIEPQGASASAEGSFRTLHIPYDKFVSRNSDVSETDQFLSLNLAINLLSEVHGFDPEVVYGTWELTGDLHLTDEHLRQMALFLQSREPGEDPPNVDDDEDNDMSDSPDPPNDPRLDDDEDNNMLVLDSPPSPTERPDPSSQRKRKRSVSPGRPQSNSPSPFPIRKRRRSRGRQLDMHPVPSSFPGKTEPSLPSQNDNPLLQSNSALTPARRRSVSSDAPETPQFPDQPSSSTPPFRVLDRTDESESEDSESEVEMSVLVGNSNDPDSDEDEDPDPDRGVKIAASQKQMHELNSEPEIEQRDPESEVESPPGNVHLNAESDDDSEVQSDKSDSDSEHEGGRPTSSATSKAPSLHLSKPSSAHPSTNTSPKPAPVLSNGKSTRTPHQPSPPNRSTSPEVPVAMDQSLLDFAASYLPTQESLFGPCERVATAKPPVPHVLIERQPTRKSAISKSASTSTLHILPPNSPASVISEPSSALSDRLPTHHQRRVNDSDSLFTQASLFGSQSQSSTADAGPSSIITAPRPSRVEQLKGEARAKPRASSSPRSKATNNPSSNAASSNRNSVASHQRTENESYIPTQTSLFGTLDRDDVSVPRLVASPRLSRIARNNLNNTKASS